MKYLTAMALAIVAAANLAHGQAYLDVPTNKSTTIIVLLHGTDAATAYTKCANVLQDEGWALEQTDATLHSITTNWKKTKGFFVKHWQALASVRDLGSGTVAVHIRANIKESTKGVPGFQEDYHITDLEFRTNMGKDWKNLMEVAGKIGSEIKYL